MYDYKNVKTFGFKFEKKGETCQISDQEQIIYEWKRWFWMENPINGFQSIQLRVAPWEMQVLLVIKQYILHE